MAGAPPPLTAPSYPVSSTSSPLPTRNNHISQSSFSTPPPPHHDTTASLSLKSTTPTSTHRLPPSTSTRANTKSIYDRHLSRSRNAELSKPAFAYLFMELLSYNQKRVRGIQDFEKRLNEQGYLLGGKCLDLLLYRMTPSGNTSSGSSTSSSSSSSSAAKEGLAVRPLRLLPLLNLLTTKLYPLLFSRPADSLEQSTSTPSEYMIIDNTPSTNTYISVPKEMSQLSVAAYIAGVVEGVCDAAGFDCKVSAHNQGTDVWPNRTVFLLKFEEAVMGREAELERMGVK